MFNLKDGSLGFANSLNKMTQQQVINELVKKNASKTNTAHMLAIRGVSAANKDEVASEIENIRTLKASIAETEKKIDANRRLANSSVFTPMQSNATAALPGLEKDLAEQKSKLDAAQKNAQLYIPPARSLGKTIGTAIASSMYSAISNYNAANAAKTSGEAFGATFANTVISSIMSGLMVGGLQGLIVGIVTAAIGGLSAFIGYQTGESKRQIDAAEEAISKLKETQEKMSGNFSTIRSLKDEFDKLSYGVDDYGNNLALTTDEYTRYKDIVKQIIDINPSLISAYDTEGNAIVKKNGLIEKSIELLEKEQELELKDRKRELGKTMPDIKKQYEKGLDFGYAERLKLAAGIGLGGVADQLLKSGAEFTKDSIAKANDIAQGDAAKHIAIGSIFAKLNALKPDEIVPTLEKFIDDLILAEKQGENFGEAIKFLDDALQKFKDTAKIYNQSQSENVNVNMQLSKSYKDLSNAHKAYLKIFLADVEDGDAITDFVDKFAKDKDLQGVVDKLFDVKNSRKSAQETADTVRSCLEAPRPLGRKINESTFFFVFFAVCASDC